MQLEYHAKALDKGVYVIGSCGFDSIPADLGILYTHRQFKGRKREGSVSYFCELKACKFNEEAKKLYEDKHTDYCSACLQGL